VALQEASESHNSFKPKSENSSEVIKNWMLFDNTFRAWLIRALGSRVRDFIGVTEMSRRILVCLAVLLGASFAGQPLLAQTAGQGKSNAESCDGPFYKVTEVTKKAKVTRLVDPDISVEALRKARGLVQIRAVFCLTGKVTNIEVIRGLPYGVTESVIEAVLKTKFKPAERDGQPVSQYFIREVKLNVQ
jgi:TonB-like protein